MESFTNIHSDIECLEEDLKSLEDKKSKLLNDLKSIRLDEELLVDSLKKKYGKGSSLNLETMEIIKK